MERKRGVFLAVILSFLVVAGAAWAHHGTSASYDMTKTITLKGTITEFVWANPHCQVYFDVKDANGKVTSWGGELMSPNRMRRQGWSKTTLKPGDKITITVYPARNGKPFGNIANIILPNGKTLEPITPKQAAERAQPAQ